jgi:hypothetical protein
MSTTFQLVNPPAALPGWYPPLDVERPNEYSIRFVELDMFIAVMSALGVVADTAASDGHIPPSAFTQPGAWIEPAKCKLISQAMRRFANEGVPEDLFSSLERRWNSVQDRFRGEVEARGEVAISGLESFPYNAKSLRGVLLHWGGFNAIAADHSGYRVIE